MVVRPTVISQWPSGHITAENRLRSCFDLLEMFFEVKESSNKNNFLVFVSLKLALKVLPAKSDLAGKFSVVKSLWWLRRCL